MKDQLYLGKEGGLYPTGNDPPDDIQKIGIEIAKTIQPLDTSEKTTESDGIIGLLPIGMSITSYEFQTFRQLALEDPLRNPRLIIVDGAVEGAGATTVANKESTYWYAVENRLNRSGVSANQVQVVWLKQVSTSSKSFPENAEISQIY